MNKDKAFSQMIEYHLREIFCHIFFMSIYCIIFFFDVQLFCRVINLIGEKKYFKLLDYVRVISCLLVLLYHLNILKGGFLAVCTFFVLTGYLSTVSALRNRNFKIGTYYKNRFKKIYIPLIVVVFITLIIIKISGINYINLKPETSSIIFGYNNYWQLHANMDYFTRFVSSPFMHFWYIAILMQFELLFPIIFALFRKIDRAVNKNISIIIVFVLMVISIVYFYISSTNKDIMVVYYGSFTRLFSIVCGCFLGLMHARYNLNSAYIMRSFKKLIFMLYSFVLIVLSIIVSSSNKYYAVFMIITTLISMRLISYATINVGFHEKKNKFITTLANMSYLIYLVQYPVIFFVDKIKMSGVIKALIIIVITFIVSYVLNRFFSTRNRYLKVIKNIVITVIVIIGGILLISVKDYSKEMKELEDKLNKNSKITNKKNDEYIKKEETKKEEKEEVNIDEMVKNISVVGVGDSVLLGTADELYNRFPNGYFDGKVSRTIRGAEEVLINLKNEGRLADTLILALANNGDYSDRINDELMEIVGDREIYWVNAVGADDPEFNSRFEEYAKRYPNIHIVRWDEAAANHPEYFYADGIHVKGDGITAYVDTIYKAIYDEYLKKYK